MPITNAIAKLPSDASNTGLQVDLNQLTVNSKTVQRQNICIADPQTAASVAQVDTLLTLCIGGLVAQGATASGNPVPIGAQYNTTPATITTGQAASLQTDAVQNLLCNTIGNVASGVADAGAPVKVGGKYNLVLPTLTDGQRGDLQLAANGGLVISGNVAAAATDSGFPIKIGAIYTTTLPAYTTGQRGNIQIDQHGYTKVGVMPIGVPIYNGSGNVAASSAVATLTIPANAMGYLDGFDIDGLGATAGVMVAVTIVGVLGGTLTLSFGIPAGVTVPIQNGHYRFNPPLQASATNTNIVVTVPTAGSGNTAVSCTAYGHYI